jgi:predicted P-loop ATPase
MSQSVAAPAMQGLDQCRQFLKGLKPKESNRELWVKFGHDSIYRATWDEGGNLSGIATKLENKNAPTSRINKGKPIPDLIKHLDSRARLEEGGVFFIPTQPIGLPMAECVTETDDIGVEMDHLSMADQKAVIAEFCDVTGLEFASVLTSGGASIHLHLKADRHYPLEEMQYFRRLAVIAFQSDPVTVRAHQPMRLPGFFRKEKNAYQELLRVSDRRYTPDDLTCAFDRWFEYKGWAFPYAISSSWWSEAWRPLFASKNTVLPSLKDSQTKEFLDEGDAAYMKRRAAESEQQRERIANLPAIAGQKISDLVQSCCDRAGLGDFDGVDWQGSGGHYRGQCPFHEGKSGSSAWLSNVNGAFRFHCSSCTDDSPRTSFEFMVARSGLSSIDSTIGLKGRDYVEAAKVFLSNYGVSLPEKPKEKPFVPIAEDKTQTIEAEFERIKSKYEEALERVEILTLELEEAEESEQKQIATRLKNAKDILKSLNSSRHNTRLELKRLTAKQKGEAETGFAKDLVVIREQVAEHLSYNLLDKAIFYKDAPTEFNSACLWLSEQTEHINWNKGDTTLSLLILDYAKKNSFCPVKRYLEAIEKKVAHSFLDQCVPYLFGIPADSTAYPLAVAAFKAQLIGSVRRVYEPGCHHRLMPILYGQQKKGKSTFLRTLYGEFASAGNLPITDKDGAMIVQRCWAFEVDECDKLFRTREASSLKSFVSLTTDTFRAPYERDTLCHPRRSVLWGTTNAQALFSDPTGNTRYPVIALPDGWEIPNCWVRENRDDIWAAALDGYWAGIPNEIPIGLENAIAEDADNYTDRDALYEPIEAILSKTLTGESLSLMEIGEKLKFGPNDFRKPEQNRVTSIMRQLGWTNKRVPYAGKVVRRWVKIS